MKVEGIIQHEGLNINQRNTGNITWNNQLTKQEKEKDHIRKNRKEHKENMRYCAVTIPQQYWRSSRALEAMAVQGVQEVLAVQLA